MLALIAVAMGGLVRASTRKRTNESAKKQREAAPEATSARRRLGKRARSPASGLSPPAGAATGARPPRPPRCASAGGESDEQPAVCRAPRRRSVALATPALCGAGHAPPPREGRRQRRHRDSHSHQGHLSTVSTIRLCVVRSAGHYSIAVSRVKSDFDSQHPAL